MQGGPSQVDTYDYKPELFAKHDQKVEFFNPRQRKVQQERVFKPLWDFTQHGQTGRWASSLFPEVATSTSMTSASSTRCTPRASPTAPLPSSSTPDPPTWSGHRWAHGSATGWEADNEQPSRPSSTINPPGQQGRPAELRQRLPAPPPPGPPSSGSPGNPNAHPEHPPHRRARSRHGTGRRANFALLQPKLNRRPGSPPEAIPKTAQVDAAPSARWNSPGGCRVAGAGEIVDLDREAPSRPAKLYGIWDRTPPTASADSALPPASSAEAGVRYIQISHCDNSSTPVWDQHSNMPRSTKQLAGQVDRPIAGLLTDLKRRGMLEDTLVWWGAEFGRTPFTQNKNGRDHNPARLHHLARRAVGSRPGHAHGATDEFGFAAVEEQGPHARPPRHHPPPPRPRPRTASPSARPAATSASPTCTARS